MGTSTMRKASSKALTAARMSQSSGLARLNTTGTIYLPQGSQLLMIPFRYQSETVMYRKLGELGDPECDQAAGSVKCSSLLPTAYLIILGYFDGATVSEMEHRPVDKLEACLESCLQVLRAKKLILTDVSLNNFIFDGTRMVLVDLEGVVKNCENFGVLDGPELVILGELLE